MCSQQQHSRNLETIFVLAEKLKSNVDLVLEDLTQSDVIHAQYVCNQGKNLMDELQQELLNLTKDRKEGMIPDPVKS